MIEEARPVQSGVELLTQTRENWLDSLIGSHINWHLALYYYGKRLSMRTYNCGSSYACANLYAPSAMSRRQQRDAAGLAVTCAGPEALEAFNRVLWAGVSYVEYLFPLAERAVELDEGLVLAHCLLGSAHKADSEFAKHSITFRDICSCRVSIRPAVLKVHSALQSHYIMCASYPFFGVKCQVM